METLKNIQKVNYSLLYRGLTFFLASALLLGSCIPMYTPNMSSPIIQAPISSPALVEPTMVYPEDSSSTSEGNLFLEIRDALQAYDAYRHLPQKKLPHILYG